jgi:hypothetical protein
VTSHTDQTRTLAVDERDELERLRAEVAQLREKVASGPPPAQRPVRSPARWWRSVVSAVLIVLACVLAPASVASVWARGLVTDTSRFVDTVAPLAQNPAVQQAITNNLTNIVFQYVDVQGLTKQAVDALQSRDVLPPAIASQLQQLAVPLANGVRSFTQGKIQEVVQSDAFASAWAEANRSVHEQVVAAINGQSGAVVLQDNAVKINLGPFLNVVKQRLIASGFELASRIPAVNASFTVFQSTDISKVQRGITVLDILGYWFPFALAAIAGLGIYLARNHRRAFIGTGIGAGLAMLITAGVLQLSRSQYLNAVPSSVISPEAAAVMFDTLVRFLRDAIRALALLGAIVAIGAFLTGPSVAAVTIRRWCVTAFAAAKGAVAELGVHMDSVTRWVAPRARLARGIVVALGFAFILFQPYKTPSLILWVTVGVLAVLAIIEFLAVEPRERRSAAATVPALTAPAEA